MEKYYYNIINNLYREIHKIDIPPNAYHKYSKQLRNNNNPATIQILRQLIINDDAEFNNKYKVVFLNDSNVRTKPRKDVQDNTILVVGLVNNIECELGNLQEFLYELKKRFKRVCFYFLTNNNTDNTVDLLKTWCASDSDVNGIYYHNTEIRTLEPNGCIGNRTVELAKLRNINIEQAKKQFGNFDYTLVLDTDLCNTISIDGFLSCFELDEEWDIICANSTYKNSDYHYDNFALRLFEQHDNISVCYPLFNKFYGKSCAWIDKLYIFDTWYKVRCAFGGAMLLKGDVHWDEKNMSREDCEHLSVCRKHKNIYVNPQFTYQQPLSLESTIYVGPSMFIPRDAGFFSVFNFYVGTLMSGTRCYPYWNKEWFMKINKQQQHFAYLTDTTNSWLEYFEPVRFFKDDHTDVSKLQRVTQGENSPVEFRIPNETLKLMQSPDFQNWRNAAHCFYKKYVRPKQYLVHKVNGIACLLGQDAIACHFRHPSHVCEQGVLYLADYFQQIDKFLTESTKIYLATDTEFGVAAFVHKYGDRVIYNKDTSRTSLDNLLEWAFARGVGTTDCVGFVNNKGYELHHENAGIENTKLGEDVLMDVLTICRCKTFIHSLSNIALACSYINPLLEMVMVK